MASISLPSSLFYEERKVVRLCMLYIGPTFYDITNEQQHGSIFLLFAMKFYLNYEFESLQIFE